MPEIKAADDNASYQAVYDKEEITYTVTWRFDNGQPDMVQKYHYGDTISKPANPTKPDDNTYTYDFLGWDPSKKLQEPVSEDVTFTAKYNMEREESLHIIAPDKTALKCAR